MNKKLVISGMLAFGGIAIAVWFYAGRGSGERTGTEVAPRMDGGSAVLTGKAMSEAGAGIVRGMPGDEVSRGSTVGRTKESEESAAARRAYDGASDPSDRLVKGANYVRRYAGADGEGAKEVFRRMVDEDLIEAAEVVTVSPSYGGGVGGSVAAGGELGAGGGTIEEVRLQPEDYAAVAEAFERLAAEAPGFVGEALDGMPDNIAFDLINQWLGTVETGVPEAVTDFILGLPSDFQDHALWGVAEVWGVSQGVDEAAANLAPVAEVTPMKDLASLVTSAVEKPRYTR